MIGSVPALVKERQGFGGDQFGFGDRDQVARALSRDESRAGVPGSGVAVRLDDSRADATIEAGVLLARDHGQ